LKSGEALTPKETVLELDKYIVGQSRAKRAVAIALRNRWRRQQVAEDMRDEIAPKNIILIRFNFIQAGIKNIPDTSQAVIKIINRNFSTVIIGYLTYQFINISPMKIPGYPVT